MIPFKLFRVRNTRSSWWQASPDAESAKEFAMVKNLARHIKNLKITGDQTNWGLNNGGTGLEKILNKREYGFLHIELGYPGKWKIVSVMNEEDFKRVVEACKSCLKGFN